MTTGKTAGGAYRPLSLLQRWKLHHAVKALRSPFHSVRVAAHREIAKILGKAQKGARRAGQQASAARSAAGGWLRKLWQKMNPPSGWDHGKHGRGKGAPVPIRQAQRQGGRAPARTGPVLTNRTLKETLKEQRAAAKSSRQEPEVRTSEAAIRPGRHEGGYVYDTPDGPITSDRALSPERVERAVRELREARTLKAEGKLPDGSAYRTDERTEVRNGVPGKTTRTAEVITPEQQKKEQEAGRKADPGPSPGNNAKSMAYDYARKEGQWRQSAAAHRKSGREAEARKDEERAERCKQEGAKVLGADRQSREQKPAGQQAPGKDQAQEQPQGRHTRPDAAAKDRSQRAQGTPSLPSDRVPHARPSTPEGQYDRWNRAEGKRNPGDPAVELKDRPHPGSGQPLHPRPAPEKAPVPMPADRISAAPERGRSR